MDPRYPTTEFFRQKLLAAERELEEYIQGKEYSLERFWKLQQEVKSARSKYLDKLSGLGPTDIEPDFHRTA